MPRCPLLRRIGLGFEFVGELVELIEIDPGLESERMRNGLRYRARTWLCPLGQTNAKCLVDHVLERQVEFAGSSLQEASQIVVDGECGAHGSVMDAK